MIYLDASALVPLFVPEASSGAVRKRLASYAPKPIALSAWTVTEAVSALGIRVRSGTLRREQVAFIIAAMDQLVRASFVLLDVEAAHFKRAAGLLQQVELGLRAGDALHVAVADQVEVERVITLDQRMAKALQSLGLGVEMPA